MKALLVAIALLFGQPGPAESQDAAASTAIRLAVFPMSSEVADVRPEWLEAAVTDSLVKLSRYDVLARTQIEAVLAEQRIANSDLVDPRTAVAAGRLVGARYVATGRLLAASFEPGFFSKDEFRARAALQLVDVETGRIVVSETLVGVRSRLVMRRGDSLSKLSAAERERSVTESSAAIGRQFADLVNTLHPLVGYVVKADGTRVAINLGEPSGVKVGQEFFVYEDAAPIRDPATGELLSVERRPIARLVVTSVEPKLAWTEVLVTYSPAARVTVAGEVVDVPIAKHLVVAEMSVVQTSMRAETIRPAFRRAQGRRK